MKSKSFWATQWEHVKSFNWIAWIKGVLTLFIPLILMNETQNEWLTIGIFAWWIILFYSAYDKE